MCVCVYIVSLCIHIYKDFRSILEEKNGLKNEI